MGIPVVIRYTRGIGCVDLLIPSLKARISTLNVSDGIELARKMIRDNLYKIDWEKMNGVDYIYNKYKALDDDHFYHVCMELSLYTK